MAVADSSGWRFAADLLVDLRMPLFAFIAGCVYALRPLELAKTAAFMIGKVKRLVVPGVIAAAIFWVLGNTLVSGAFSSGATLLSAITLSYGHFWFLQAVLILFLTVGVIDAALRYKAAVPLLVAACILYLVWDGLGIRPPSELELARAVYLSPGFLMGIVVVRHGDALVERSALLVVAAAICLIVGLALNLQTYWETGRLSTVRKDVQSLLVGGGSIILLYIFTPRMPWFDKLAALAFTVYLYHPFGTAIARRLFNGLEVESDIVRFVFGVIIGFAAPVLVHVCAARSGVMRRLILGQRNQGRSADSMAVMARA